MRLDKRDVNALARQCVRAAAMVVSADDTDERGSEAIWDMARDIARAAFPSHDPHPTLGAFPQPFTLEALLSAVDGVYERGEQGDVLNTDDEYGV